MNDKTAAALLKFLLTLLMLPVGVVLNGYALSVRWGWFIVPIFGMPSLSIVTAAGLALVVSYLTHQLHEKNNDGLSFTIVVTLIKPAFGLFFGWILTLFL
jgi:hypothetical protein